MVMFNILECVDFYSGTERKKMLKVSKGNGSMLFGNTWKGFLKYEKDGTKVLRAKDPNENGKYLTKVKAENPELEPIFREYANKYFPIFEYSQVQMNKSFPCPPHNDRNKGESICVAFGDYLGGDLCIEMDLGNKNKNVIECDPRIKPVQFDGKKWKHWVKDFCRGDRYSLVFFNN